MASYYYAGGRKLELALDAEHAAVPVGEALRLGVTLPKGQRELPGEVSLVRRDELTKQQLQVLQHAGALRTVYRYRGTLMVPLPEVRVELEEGQLDSVLQALKQASIAAEVDDSTPGRLLVRPKSNLGDDALSLANEITERAKPAMSSAKMVQVTARPDLNQSKQRAPLRR
jgi:hypothetical protein